jgi:hypothetical protein
VTSQVFKMASCIATSPAVELAPGAESGAAQQITAFIEVLLLGVWLGSMIFFSFAVAPSAFAVLPTREMAGVMVTSTIGKIEVLGLIVGTLLILIQVANWRSRQSSRAIKTLQTLLLLLMIASAALSRFWISPAMVSLRAQYSVGLMSAAMISGLVVLFLTVRSWSKR